MTSRDDLRHPLPLAYHPLYRFYQGGALTRAFRGLPARPDDWWSEDWVGSCTCAGNTDPAGRPQGLSTVDLPSGQVTLKSLVETWPEEMGRADVLVKLLSPAGPVPLHAHPTRAWARRYLGSPYGKTEAWILLDTPGEGAYAGIGFVPGVTREGFAEMVRRRDPALRDTLHRTEVHPGEVYVAHAGVPHYLGPRLSFIEVQEPSDHIVIPETSGEDDAAATMGLGWDLALDMIDYGTADAAATFARARQRPRVLRSSHGSREVRLLRDDVTGFFDATALEVADEIEVGDGRFSIAIVVSGDGSAEGDFGREPIRKGQTFAWPASLALRVRAGREPLRVVRCLGPDPGETGC
jgi:mannose-6-phosphate isomerase